MRIHSSLNYIIQLQGSNDKLRTSENPFLHQSTKNNAKWSKSTFLNLQINQNLITKQGALIQEKKAESW